VLGLFVIGVFIDEAERISDSLIRKRQWRKGVDLLAAYCDRFGHEELSDSRRIEKCPDELNKA
jgi:hypothetical protein